jgi:hypothetical protein
VVNSLYSRGFREAGRKLNRLVSLGKRVVDHTKQVLSGESPGNPFSSTIIFSCQSAYVAKLRNYYDTVS